MASPMEIPEATTGLNVEPRHELDIVHRETLVDPYGDGENRADARQRNAW